MAAACRSATVGKHSASASSRKHSASASSRRGSEPFAVLNDSVDISEFTGEPGGKWRRIECASQKAYGCGDLGQELVEGLRLYMRFGDHPVLTSSLAIRMSDKAVRWIGAELGAPNKGEDPRGWMRASGTIKIANQRLFAIILVFRHLYNLIAYYLVYDDIDASLSLIKCLPDHHDTCCTQTPVLNRVGERGGGDYELVLLARKLPSCVNNERVLCTCTPDSRANPSADFGIGPWKVKGWRFPEEVREPFLADEVFTFQGKAFWVDFTRGYLLYCDLRTCGDSSANFMFIRLPRKCVIDPHTPVDDVEPMKMIRTIGCVGDSIWLVCIHRLKTIAEDLLTMWTLDLANKQWKQEVEISAKSIWNMDCYKKAGLPKASLDYPVLTADGALCLLLRDDRGEDDDEFGPIVDRICCIDVRRGNLLWHGRVHDYHHTSSPVMLPCNFFQRLHAPAKWATTKHLPEPASNGSTNINLACVVVYDGHHGSNPGLKANPVVRTKLLFLPKVTKLK